MMSDFNVQNPTKSAIIGFILGATAGIIVTKIFKGDVCMKCVSLWAVAGAVVGYYQGNK